jgi:hypothetical protein
MGTMGCWYAPCLKRPWKRRSLSLEEMMKKGSLALAAMFFLVPQGLLGQVRRAQDADLPRWVEEDVISFFNDPSTIQFSGRSRIPSTRVLEGDVGTLGGPFTLAGRIDGNLVVVNGDLVFEAGGSVTGDVLIVGGRVLGENLGEIQGTLRVFDEPLRYVQRGDRIAAAGRRTEEEEGFSRSFFGGDARLILKTGQNYNRVEGLPVVFGPSIRTQGSNPLRLDIWGVWRTEMGLELGSEDFGYQFRVEQAFGGRDQIGAGATFYSFVDPIEDWGLSNLEASLATFVLHKDFRDYFDRTGWSAFARFRFPFLPVELRAEYFQEEHGFSPVGGPWSLTKNNQPWRSQPLVAEGDLRYLEETLTIDTRDQRNRPSDGWIIRATARQGVGGEIFLPEHLASTEPDAPLIPQAEYETDFFTGFLDIRSYNRVGPNSFLNLRGIFGGVLNDRPLPPQFQHAAGGIGSLPGYSLFSVDCGARVETRALDVIESGVPIREPVFPGYGCDQIALFQAEFRGSLFLDWGLGGGGNEDPWGDDWDWAPRFDLSPAWAAFFDAGKGWSVNGRNEAEAVADVGLGLYLGDLGVFYAYPLKEETGRRKGGTFFIRLNRRF